MKKIVIAVAVILVASAALMIVSFTQNNNTPPAQKIATDNVSESPGEIKNQNFPDLDSFSSETLDGGQFTYENFRNYDLTVVNIWGTFCPPCRAEMPELASFANALPSNIQFITICTDASGNTGSAKKILSDAGFTGVTLVSGDEQYNRLLYKIQYVPTTLFYDSQGKCIGSEIIGSPNDFSGEYKNSINSILSAMGKQAI